MQLTLEGSFDAAIVNVASVPQRSPFRYAGGKSWLVPRARRWLGSLPFRPSHFIEPFAGGASIGLAAAFENGSDHTTLVEIDADVAAVWRTILSDNADWLAARIRDFDLSAASARAVVQSQHKSVAERAFATLVRNRVNHGGILAPGVGMLKTGENGRGIASRWYPETLARRIEAIALHRFRLSFIQADGLEIIRDNATCPGTVFFIDPPYTVGGKNAGSRLYLHNSLDHHRLFALATQVQGAFLMCYDNTDEARALADEHGFQTRAIAMKNTHHAKMTELLISRDLSWL